MDEKTCQNPACDNSYPVSDSVGYYCSITCKYRHQGSKLLSDIEDSHTHCASCGKELKEIEKPHSTHPDVYIGYQYRTPHAQMGEKTVLVGDKEIDTTGTICKHCGTTDHKDAYLREFFFSDFVKRVLRYLQEQYDRGKLDHPVDYIEVVELLQEGFSLEYSLGKAFHD